MRNLRTAMLFLYGLGAGADDAAGPGADTSAPQPAGWIHWIVPLSLAVWVPLVLAMMFSWQLLTLRPGVGGLWVATAPLMLIYWLGPGAARYVGFGRTWAIVRPGRRPSRLILGPPEGAGSAGLAALAIAAAAATQFVLVAVLPTAAALFDRWPIHLSRWVFPRTLYGALVLMGLWGNASVVLASALGRPAGHAEPSVRQLMACKLWVRLTWGLAPSAAISVLFIFGWTWRWGNSWASMMVSALASGLIVAVIVFGVVMMFGWLLARRGQGHCRASLLAAGLIGELTFLLVFHALIK